MQSWNCYRDYKPPEEPWFMEPRAFWVPAYWIGGVAMFVLAIILAAPTN